MKIILIATSAAFGFGIGAARAADGRGDPFGLDRANLPMVSNPVSVQTGQAAYPTFSRWPQVAVTTGGMVPSTGSQGILESPSSLSSAPEIGGVWPPTALQPAISSAG